MGKLLATLALIVLGCWLAASKEGGAHRSLAWELCNIALGFALVWVAAVFYGLVARDRPDDRFQWVRATRDIIVVIACGLGLIWCLMVLGNCLMYHFVPRA